MADQLSKLRTQIDSIDNQIVDLLNNRMAIVQEIGKNKSGNNLHIYHPEREDAILNRLLQLNETSSFPDKILRRIYAEIMAASRQLQRPLKIGYLGPQATYTHMAVVNHFGSSTELGPYNSISEIFRSVELGKTDYGVVPVENSTEGVVTHTLDRFMESSLNIVSEIYLRISHCFLSRSQDFSKIKKIYSHPQSIAQCKKWLSDNMHDIELCESSSNAKAALIASKEKHSAAIAGNIAAEVYGLNILSEGIEDNPVNITRFLVIGKNICKPTVNDKTSIVCSVKNKPGALYELLRVFANCDINMTKIESRPSGKKAWEYLFFIDMEGHQESDNIKKLLDQIEGMTRFVKILGSYPAGKMID